jgi:hypothetical protein
MVSEKVGVAYLTGIGLAQGDTAAFDKATWGLDSTGLETFFFSSESYRVSMLKLILADPRTFFQVLVMNTQHLVQAFIDLTLFPYALLPLVVLGLLRRGWSRQRTLQELFLIVSTGPVLAFILFFIQARYLVPLLPLFILWTAAGLADLSDWLIGTVVALRTPPAANPAAASGRPYWHMPRLPRVLIEWGPVVVVMGVLLLIYPAVLRNVTNVGSVRPGHKLVGEWLLRNTPAEVVIMSRYPAIAFHAERAWQPTPNASWVEIVNYARHKKVTHLVIDERELRYRPQLKALVEAKTIPPEVTLILRHINADSNEQMVVYELLP